MITTSICDEEDHHYDVEEVHSELFPAGKYVVSDMDLVEYTNYIWAEVFKCEFGSYKVDGINYFCY